MPDLFALTGWYGRGNIGDELLLRAVARRLREHFPDTELVALSLEPWVSAEAAGCPAIVPFHPYRSWRDPRAWAAFAAQLLGGGWLAVARRATALVVGGGSLLHDRQPGNLELWLRLVRLYRRLGVKVFFYGAGLGPFRGGNQSYELVKQILDQAIGASFRDPVSADLAESLLPGRGFVRASDPVTGLLPIRSRRARNLEASAPLRVGFNISRWAAVSDPETIEFGSHLASVWLNAAGGTLQFLPMSRSDRPLAAAIGSRLPAQCAPRFQIAPHDIDDLDRHIGRYGKLDLVITSRLHTAVLAAAANLPVVGIDTDPKLPAFLNEAGYGGHVVPAPAGASDFAAAARSVLSQARSLIEGWPKLQGHCVERMQKLAEAEVNSVNELKRALAA